MHIVSSLLIVVALISSGFAYTFSISKFDDIKVINSNGKIQCDKIECPKNTVQCHVSKRNSEENPSKVVREIVCYGTDEKILQRKSWSEANYGNKEVNVQIDMFKDGRTSMINEGSSMGLNQGFFDEMSSMLQQIGNYFSGFQDFFFNPFGGFV